MSDVVNFGLEPGILSFTVLPVYAGAVNNIGQEPITSPDYERGQIGWHTDVATAQRFGHATIEVPPGEYRWIIYGYHPTDPRFYAVVKLHDDLIFDAPGDITLDQITEAEVQPNAHPLQVLPD